MIRVIKPAPGMKVLGWSVTGNGGPTVTGFDSCEAATAWAAEWAAGDTVAPIVDVVSVTQALTRFEVHRQRNESIGLNWKDGLPDLSEPSEDSGPEA